MLIRLSLQGSLLFFALSSTGIAALVVSSNMATNIAVQEGNGGTVNFTFTNTGSADRIAGAGMATFATQGDATDNISAHLGFGSCDPFAGGGNNMIGGGGSCTLMVDFTSPATPGPEEAVPDSGTTRVRVGVALASGAMAFGQVNITVNDIPAPPPPEAALNVVPTFARVTEGGAGTLSFVITNTGGVAANIQQLTPTPWHFFGDVTDDAAFGPLVGCGAGTVIAPFGSCTVMVGFTTPATADNAENFDFGITALSLDVVLLSGANAGATGAVWVDDTVPEPGTLVLFGLGTLGLLGWRCRSAISRRTRF